MKIDNVDFDGSNDYVETVNADCTTSSAFTFSTWVKRDRYGTAHVDRLMISVGDGGWGVGFGDMWEDDRLFLTKVGVGAVYSTGTISDTDWHFITVTFDGAAHQVKFYIDGDPAGTCNNVTWTFSSSGVCTIGARGSSAEFLDGKLDEVAVWERALSPTEAEALYDAHGDATAGTLGTDLLLAYHFSENTGSTAHDYSGNGHDGTIYDASWWTDPDQRPQPGVVREQYVWSPRYVDAPIVRFHDGNGDGDCDPATDAADNIRYYTGDANYNVTTTITVGYTGTVTEHYAYNAYGKATVYDENWDNGVAPTADGPLYCGYWFDSETGNSQVRNREYITCLSTFDATDPIGYRGGINRYEYVGDNAVVRTDPNGLFWPEVYDNGKGQVCGYSIFLLTGSWCADPNVVIAATDAYDKYVTCWWDCEVSVHKCVTTYAAEAAAAACTTAFTHWEIAKGAVRQGIGKPGDVTTLQSALALKLAQMGYKGIGQQLLRRGAQQVSGHVVSSGIKSGVCGIALVETTVAWACAWKCS